MARKSVVRQNMILSMGFGFLMGCVFPVYAGFFVVFPSTLLLVFFVAGCLVAGLVVGFVSFRISGMTYGKTIESINRQLEGIRKNDFSEYRPVVVASEDIIGELTSGFNFLMNRVITLYSGIRARTAEAGESTREIRKDVDRSIQTMQEISREVERLYGKTSSQSGILIETDGDFRELNKVILLNLSGIIELFSSLDKFRETLDREAALIRQVFESLGGIKTKVSTTAASFSRVVETTSRATGGVRDAFGRISARLERITEISEQTNVLSINASIEAARLGRQGDGFRVIATNIKDLASLVSNFVAEMRSEIEEDGRRTRAATDSALALSRQFESGIEAINEEYEKLQIFALDESELLETVRQSNELLRTSLEDIRSNMNVLKSSAEKAGTSIASTITSLDENIAVIGRINDVIGRDRERRDHLENTIGRYFDLIQELEPDEKEVHRENRRDTDEREHNNAGPAR